MGLHRVAGAARLKIIDQPVGKQFQPVSVDEVSCLHRFHELGGFLSHASVQPQTPGSDSRLTQPNRG
jgi:hypothetical protein